MGKASRSVYAPRRLGEKLLQIRRQMGLTQEELLLKRLAKFPTLQQSVISAYERGDREPPLLVILAYARIIGTSVDTLLDDEVDLPKNFNSA